MNENLLNIESIKMQDIRFGKYTNELQEAMKLLLENDYTVIIYESLSDQVVSFHYTKDNEHFAYAQQWSCNFWLLELATVHEGSKAHGTGTMLQELRNVNLNDLTKALEETKKECKRLNLKPTSKHTFSILKYKKVVL